MLPGKIKPELFHEDQIHLNGTGYDAWDSDLGAVIRGLLKKTAVAAPQGPHS
jgi:hypothetical protein